MTGTNDSGQRLVTIPEDEYQQLLDALDKVTELADIQELLATQVKVMREQVDLDELEWAVFRKRLGGLVARSVITNALAFSLYAGEDEDVDEVHLTSEQTLRVNKVGGRVQDQLTEWLFGEAP